MAGIPSWREQLPQSYVGAKKWGTGWNPVHAKRTGYEGRNFAPPPTVPPDPGVSTGTWDYTTEVPGEDTSWMDPHPNWGENRERGYARMPSWGHGALAASEGTAKRALKEGYNPREGEVNAVPKGVAGEGWLNKIIGSVLDSISADESQLYVQTSSTQRDAVRNNSAAQARGTDAARHDIGSRIPGMREKHYSGGIRHEEMTPREINYRPRPFLVRSAGTGNPAWMDSNAENPNVPKQRTVPADVYQGREETSYYSNDSWGDSWW